MIIRLMGLYSSLKFVWKTGMVSSGTDITFEFKEVGFVNQGMKEKEVDFYLHLANLGSIILIALTAALFSELRGAKPDFIYLCIEVFLCGLVLAYTISLYVYAFRIIKGKE